MPISELADWWDGQRKQSDKLLDQWVLENPQWWAIGIATATATAMDLGAGLVDTLRLGQGVAEGGPKGYAKDALRLLALVGPLGRIGGLAGRLAQTQLIRLAVTTEDVTGPCTFRAVNNALSITRGWPRNLFVTARDAAKALGQSLSEVAKVGADYDIAAWIDELVPFLTKQGVPLRSLGIARSLEQVTQAAATNDGVVIFAIKWTNLAGETEMHSMIAVRTINGVRFADYMRPTSGRFMASLSELARRGGTWVSKGGYQIASDGAYGNAVLVQGMKVIGALDRYSDQVAKGSLLLLEGMRAVATPDGVDLAFPVTPAVAIEKGAHDPEVVKQSFDAFKARKQGRPLVRLPPIKIVGRVQGPPRSDLLTGVQYRLNALGFGAGPVDGIIGRRTKRAIRDFQETYSLPVDSIPGPITQRKLVEICGF